MGRKLREGIIRTGCVKKVFKLSWRKKAKMSECDKRSWKMTEL